MQPKIHVDLPRGLLIQNLNLDLVGWVAGGDATLDDLVFAVDGVPIAVSYLQRPDVERAFPKHTVSGWVGHVDHTTILRSPGKTLTLEVSANAQTVFRKVFLKSKFLLDARNNSPLFFMHIPKTAGTALRQFVDYAFREFSSLYVYGDYPGVPTDLIGALDPAFLKSRELVYGHFGFGSTNIFGATHPKIVTVFREPTELVASYAAFTSQPSPEFFDNPLVRHVSRVGYGVAYGEITAEHLEQAADLLNRHFYVLHAHRLQEFADTLTDAFKLNRFVIPSMNKGARLGRAPTYPVAPLLQHDKQLYEMALAGPRDFFDFINAPLMA